jgi:hypothetical protein
MNLILTTPFKHELSSLGLGPGIESKEEFSGTVDNLLGLGRAGTKDGTSGYSGSDARRLFKSLLTSSGGRQVIRDAFSKLTIDAARVENLRKALIRGLLRARRDLQGPSADQRKDLMSLIFKKDGGPTEPFFSE